MFWYKVRKRNLLAFLLISILSGIVYANSLDNAFHFDDQHYVVRNTYIRKIQNIPTFFQSPRYSSSEKPFTGHYRPLVVSTYALNYALGGLNPSGYHIVNLGFHVGTAFMVFLIVQAMSGSSSYFYIALASALIFAVHPFNSEVVNYITARSSVMCAFFYLLAFYCWVKYRWVGGSSKEVAGSSEQVGGKAGEGSQLPATRYPLPATYTATYFYVASLLAFLLAMLSKEIAITLPLVLWLYDFYFVPAGGKTDHLRRILLYTPFVASVAFPYLIARKLFYGSFITSGFNRDLVLNLYTQAKIVVGYLRLLLFPAGLTIDHPMRLARTFWESDVVLSEGLLLAILWIAYYLWKRQEDWQIVSFFIVWFFVTLLPVTIIPLNAMMQENRAYLAGVGLAVFIGIGIWKLAERSNPPLPPFIYLSILIPLLLVYSTTTIHRNRVWKDDVSLWSDAVKKAPLSTRSYDNLGLAYDGTGNMEKAEEMYQKTLRLDPNYLFAYYNLGVLYQKQREWEKAANYYQEAVRLDPVYFNAYYNLGLVYQETGQYQKAIEAYEKAISSDSRHPHAYNNLGVAYWLKGEKEEAIRSFLKAVERGPDHVKAYYNLGNVYQEIGDYRKAIDAYQAVLNIDPAYREAKERLRQVKEEGRR